MVHHPETPPPGLSCECAGWGHTPCWVSHLCPSVALGRLPHLSDLCFLLPGMRTILFLPGDLAGVRMLKGLSIRKHATSSDSLTLGIFVGHVAEGERQPAAGPAWTASCVSLHRLLCNLTLSSGDRSCWHPASSQIPVS